MPLSAGTRLGPYEVLAPLGAGGMGEVYRARDTQLKREVALKVLPAAVATDPERLARFQREAELLAALNHPHIAQIYGVAEADGVRALVMELVEGPTLAERIAQGPIPIAEALPIARQLAEALDEAHERGIVHRDLKPANIKVTPAGAVKVLDFGLAKALSADAAAEAAALSTMTSPAQTQAGIILGTAAYMSPEQARGKVVDKRADIWAFGVVLYEMLTGAKAFPGETITDVLGAIVKTEPDWTLLPKDVPPRVRGLMEHCLQKDPRARLRDIGDARRELGAGDASLESAGPPTGSRARTAVVLTIAAAIVAALSFLAGRSRPAPAPTSDSSVSRTSILLPADAPMVFVGEAPHRIARRSLALSPDGTLLAYVGKHRDRTSLYLRPIGEDQVRRLEGTEGAYSPFFSPSGQWIGYFSQQRLFKVPVTGGRPVELAQAPEVYGGVWLRDGRILFGRDEGTRMVVVDENGGGAADTAEFPPMWVSSRIPSTDSVLGSIWEYPTVALGSIGDSSPRVLTARGFVKTALAPVIYPRGSPHYLAGGYLLAAASGRLYAARFSRDSLERPSSFTSLDEFVRHDALEIAQFSLSDGGILAYAPGANVEESLLAMAAPNGPVETLPFERAAYLNPAFSPDGRRLSVTVRTATGMDMRVLDLGTALASTVFSTAEFIVDPFWTSDGANIRFTNFRGALSEAQIMEVAASGGQPRVVEPGTRLHGVSRDGVWTAVSKAGGLMLRGPETSHTALVPPGGWVDVAPGNTHVAWSAVSDKGYEVYVSALPLGGPVASVTPDGCLEGKWMPDGKELVCFRDDGLLYRIPVTFDQNVARGGQPRRITSVPLLETGGHTWALSRDGRKMVFVAAQADDTTQVIHIVTNFQAVVEKKLAGATGQGAR